MSDDNKQAMEPAVEAAMATMGLMNLAAFFASPRIVAASRGMHSRESALEIIDKFLSVMSSIEPQPMGAPAQSLHRTLTHVRALRLLVAAWGIDPGPNPPLIGSILEKEARSLLHAFGIDEPLGGWDQFEPPHEDLERAADAVAARAGPFFPGLNHSVYNEIVRLEVSGHLLAGLAEDGHSLGTARAQESRREPTIDQLERGADRLVAYANNVKDCLDRLSVFLSSYSASTSKRIPTRREVLEHLDGYLEFAERLRREPTCARSRRLAASAPDAAKLVSLFLQWTPTADVPAEISEAVRALFRALAIREPPEGWDRFEGFRQGP